MAIVTSFFLYLSGGKLKKTMSLFYIIITVLVIWISLTNLYLYKKHHCSNVKVVIFVPETCADEIRAIIGNNGAGSIGHYDFCSFTTKGIARFRPLKGASPFIGKEGQVQEVHEERIEFICPIKLLPKVLQAIKKAHPYEEMGYDVYPLCKI